MCILIIYDWFAENVNVEFVYHYEQNRALLKLMIKHVKTCA